MPHSQHSDPSTVYVWLAINAFFAAGFGIVFPYLLLREARHLRYMQNVKARLFARFGALTLTFFGIPFAVDIINEHLWSNHFLQTFFWLFSVVFVVMFSLSCWANRQALRLLFPKEDFEVEQEKRRHLLDKLNACDERMPLPRMESRHGVIVYANQAATALFGYSLLELHKLPPGALVIEEERADVLGYVLAKETTTFETRLRTRAGQVLTFEIHSCFDPNDADLRISFLTDVTRYVEERDKRQREYLANQAERGKYAALAELDQQFGLMHRLPA